MKLGANKANRLTQQMFKRVHASPHKDAHNDSQP